ncbi:MAG: hypothetical protein JKP90_21325 [Desulfofustis sp. PB-SRB1]|nr:hypothetical protein [Desulfofustis sp. PB-SRB1]
MYIRRAQIKSRKDGGKYYTYRLVESKRTATGVKQYTLLNLGTDFSLPREQWPDLARRVEDILSGQQSLFEIDSDIEKTAQDIAAKLIVSQHNTSQPGGTDYREVDLDTIDLSRPRSVGAEHVSLEALRMLGLEKKLAELGVQRTTNSRCHRDDHRQSLRTRQRVGNPSMAPGSLRTGGAHRL